MPMGEPISESPMGEFNIPRKTSDISMEKELEQTPIRKHDISTENIIQPNMKTPSSKMKTPSKEILQLGEQYKSLGIVTDKTLKIIAFLKSAFKTSDELSTFNLMKESKKENKKEVVARFFSELLVLKTKNIIDISQNEPFSDILIKKTKLFV